MPLEWGKPPDLGHQRGAQGYPGRNRPAQEGGRDQLQDAVAAAVLG